MQIDERFSTDVVNTLDQFSNSFAEEFYTKANTRRLIDEAESRINGEVADVLTLWTKDVCEHSSLSRCPVFI